MSPMQPQDRHWWKRWPMMVWLALVWVLLWGDFSIANVIAGLVLGALLVSLAPMPKVGFFGRVWLPGVVVLLVKFAWDVILASVHVSWYALRIGRYPKGAVIHVPLRSHSDLILTLTGQFTSLVPGSIIVEAHRLTGTLYVHWFDAEGPEEVEQARTAVFAQERRLLYALASDAELAEVGLPSRKEWWRGGWRHIDDAAAAEVEQQS